MEGARKHEMRMMTQREKKGNGNRREGEILTDKNKVAARPLVGANGRRGVRSADLFLLAAI